MKHKLKIMIVDDHEIFRKSLKMTINRFFPDTEFEEAENGKAFLEIIKNNKFDLVLMDIKMPEMNGIETTEIAKQKYPDLKILGISLFGTDDDIKKMENAGASGFLRKGGDIEEIEKAIKIILKGGKYITLQN